MLDHCRLTLNPKELDKCKAAAQELVNAQDKGEAEGGIIYGYMYTMNNSDYGFKGDDLEFKSTEEMRCVRCERPGEEHLRRVQAGVSAYR